MHLPTSLLRVLFKALACFVFFNAIVHAAPPDLTANGVIAGIDRSSTYNLGATGLRGWIWVDRNNVGDYGLMTDQSRQILVTHCVTPANAELAINDVILGAIAANSGTVPDFTSDCRKAFGAALTEAEKSGAGTLRVKRWRSSDNSTADVNIPITIMGNYASTAPYDFSMPAPHFCPKSKLILDSARNKLVSDVLASTDYFQTYNYGSAIDALALLASVQSGDPNYAAIQTRLESFALALATEGPKQRGLDIWTWAYDGIFLAEYYLITNDARVLAGINDFTLKLARSQSMYGTFGHNPAMPRPDGTGRMSVIGYGPVNLAGVAANLAIVLGKKALVAGSQSIDSEIDTAIERGTNFFAWYVNKGSIPYGEHAPGADNHASNGKDQIAAMLFAQFDNRLAETEFYTRMSIAGFAGREYGHTGQGFSYMWEAMAANIGGSTAVAEYLKQVRWHLDLSRRTDGSFAYDGQEQYGGGSTDGNTYLGRSHYYGLNATTSYLLTLSLPLKRLVITGKNANPAHILDSTKIANALSAATYKLDCTSRTVPELTADLSEYDPVTRNYAAKELASRSFSATELTSLRTTLRAMLIGSNANARMGACQALGLIKDPNDLAVITQRLDKTIETNPWVRATAAKALRSYPSNTFSSQRDPMLTAFAANAADPNNIDWEDPLQNANGFLSLALFSNGVPDGSEGNDIASYTKNATKGLLYPAVKASFKQPDSYPRSGAGRFLFLELPLTDVQAMINDVIQLIRSETECDRMWSASPRALGIRALAKYKVRDGIPLAVDLLDVPPNFGFGSDEYLVAALNSLASYGDAARYTLPTLRSYLTKWSPTSSEYATLVTTIASIEAAITAPAQVPGKAIANAQMVSTTGAKSITLTGSSPRSSVTYTNVTAPAHGTITGTAPNLTYTPTPGYTGPDHFSFQTVDNITTSEPATVAILVGTPGNGLKAEYFDNADFTNLKLSRNDAQVNFDWGTGSPNAAIAADTFSVRWSGLLLIPETGTYTFSTLNSDGVRLYLNGNLIIDDSTNHDTRWNDSTPLYLVEGQMMEIVMDYYENTGSAVAKLKWTGPSHAGSNGDIIGAQWLFDGSGISNRSAFAHPQNVTTVKNTAVPISLNGSGGTLTYTVLTQPANGTLTGTAPNLTYTPSTNYSGTDSFTFLVNNGNGNSAPATVSISVWAGLPVTYTWSGNNTGNWSTTSNWVGNNAPPATGQPFYAINFAPTGTYTATQDIGNAYQLNQLILGGDLTLSGTNSLSFVTNGTVPPLINQNSNSTVTINQPLNFAAMTTLGGSGGGNVHLNGLLSCNGGLTKNTTGILRINQFNNTYSGSTVLNSGRIILPDGDGNVTPHFGTGSVTINANASVDFNRTILNNTIFLNNTTFFRVTVSVP